MNRMLFGKRLLMPGLVLLSMLVWQGCGPAPVKTIDLSPVDPHGLAVGRTEAIGSTGFCITSQNIPPEPLSAGQGEVLVGFDDFFNPGTDPFPCKNLRDDVFRGAVLFDVSQFDSIATADLLFNVDGTVDRQGGQNLGQSPIQSAATTLGVATEAFSSFMRDDNEVPLPPTGPSIDVNVSSQVRDWIGNVHPNFGFVLGGPRPAIPQPPPSNVAEDNDAQASFYSGFKLHILYNPAQNPRAPQ